MRQSKKEKDFQIVVCLNNTGYTASLELHKIYRALPDDPPLKMATYGSLTRVVKIIFTRRTGLSH